MQDKVNKSMKITNSVIVITAAGTRTGSAIAEYFCQLGAHVALVDIEPTQLESSFKTCVETGGTCYSFVLNSLNIESISHLFNEISDQLGDIDVLINYWQTNGLPYLLANEDTTHFFSDITLNPYLFGRGAALKMLAQKRKGVIINIPSIEKNKGSEDNSATAVMRGLTQSWAKELAPANIRVAGVLPELRHIDKGIHRRESLINYDMLDGAVYIVENDSFNGRMLETVS